MSLDTQTGRYCVPCSIDLLWRVGDIPGALDGLPPRSETVAKPITELLCEYHAFYFRHIPLLLMERDTYNIIQQYPNHVPAMVTRGAFPRPQHPMACDMSQDELLDLLTRMERGLRLVHAEYLRARIFEVICEQPTVTLPTAGELVEHARLHAAIYDYLAEQRGSDRRSGLEPSAGDLMEIEYDDRISGEE